MVSMNIAQQSLRSGEADPRSRGPLQNSCRVLWEGQQQSSAALSSESQEFIRIKLKASWILGSPPSSALIWSMSGTRTRSRRNTNRMPLLGWHGWNTVWTGLCWCCAVRCLTSHPTLTATKYGVWMNHTAATPWTQRHRGSGSQISVESTERWWSTSSEETNNNVFDWVCACP